MARSPSIGIEKCVLVIGESGVGKSTIVNMLYNQDTSADCCSEPCATGSTAASITKASSLHLNMRSHWALVDTVGVGDPELDSKSLLRAIHNVVQHATRGVNCVVIVMKMGRVPAAARANVDLLRQLFRQRDLQSHGVLVLTHWEGELGDEEQCLRDWIGSDAEIADLVGNFSKTILTNNQVKGRGAYPESRQQCLLQLNDVINVAPYPIQVLPVKVMDIFYYIIKKYFGVLWKRASDGIRAITVGETAAIPTYCGSCSICFEQVELAELCCLPCNHNFHAHCITDVDRCPECRSSFQPDECFWFRDV